MACICNPSAWEGRIGEECEASLCCVMSWRLAWAIQQEFQGVGENPNKPYLAHHFCAYPTNIWRYMLKHVREGYLFYGIRYKKKSQQNKKLKKFCLLKIP